MSVAQLEQVEPLECKGHAFPLLTVGLFVRQLAAIAGLRCQEWLEPGLGQQIGFNVRLPEGMVVHAEECVERPDLGVAFYADSATLGTNSISQTIESIQMTFGLQPEAMPWEQSTSSFTPND